MITIKTALYNTNGMRVVNFSGTEPPKNILALMNKQLLIAFDQATIHSGISIFDLHERKLLLAGLIERDSEPSPIAYKVEFKKLLLNFVKQYDIKIIMHEDVHFQGLLDVTTTLAVMKAVFEELKYEHPEDFGHIEIFPTPSGAWKKFIGATKTSKHAGINHKKIIKNRVLEQFPKMEGLKEDTYDAIGIGLAYFAQDDPQNEEKRLKRIKVNKKFHQIIYAEYLTDEEYEEQDFIWTDPELGPRAYEYGAQQFEYSTKDDLDMNFRYRTNQSNAVWHAVVPEHRMMSYIWLKYNIAPQPGKKLVVYGMRKNPTKFA